MSIDIGSKEIVFAPSPYWWEARVFNVLRLAGAIGSTPRGSDRRKRMDLSEKYMWVKERLHSVFPEAYVYDEVQQYGRAYVVVVHFPLVDKIWALQIEAVETIGGVMQWMVPPWVDEEEKTPPMEWMSGPPYMQKTVGIGVADDPQAALERFITDIQGRLCSS